MSSQLKKKIKKKKKKISEEEIQPQKHERIGNINYYSEEIVRNMIEKIISLVIADSFNKNLKPKFGEFCNKEIIKTINNITELNNINHEIDDFDIDKIEINSYINYNNTDTNIQRYLIKRHNIAYEIRNDKASKNLDNYKNTKNKKINEKLDESTLVEKNKYFSKGKLYQYDIIITKNNFWGDIPCPKVSDIDRTTSNHNNYKKKEKEKKSKIFDRIRKSININKDKNKMFRKQYTASYKNFISKLSKNLGFLQNKKDSNIFNIFTPRKKYPQMIDMPSFPIEEKVEQKKESDEIIRLRSETMELIIQKEKMKKKKIIIKPEKSKEDIEKEKKMKKGKYTYDCQGNIIFIRDIRQDYLSKEFWPVTSKQKDIKPGKTSDECKKELIKMENNAQKNIEYNDNDKNYGSFLIKSRLTQPLINFNESLLKNIFRDNDSNNQNNSKNIYNELLLKVNKPRIEPSGSNFKLINPAIGVTVKERTKAKSGGNNFYSQFHKYSINDFNKTLQDTLEWSKLKLNNENPKEEFNPTATTELPNLKKSNLIKNMIKEEKENEIDTSEIKAKNVKLDFNQKINHRRIRNKNIDNLYRKTKLESTSSSMSKFLTNTNKKTLIKSSSEIIIDNDKFMKLKDILFHNKDEYMINPYKTKFVENKNIFEYKNRSDIRKKNKKGFDLTKGLRDIDNFNKSIITGKVISQRTVNGKMVLPKISLRNNEINFNKTMIMLNKERTKKTIWEDYLRKKQNDIKTKKFKKVNPFKAQ